MITVFVSLLFLLNIFLLFNLFQAKGSVFSYPKMFAQKKLKLSQEIRARMNCNKTLQRLKLNPSVEKDPFAAEASMTQPLDVETHT